MGTVWAPVLGRIIPLEGAAEDDAIALFVRHTQDTWRFFGFPPPLLRLAARIRFASEESVHSGLTGPLNLILASRHLQLLEGIMRSRFGTEHAVKLRHFVRRQMHGHR